MLSYSEIELEFINQRLKRADISFSCRMEKHFWPILTEFQPLFFVMPEFVWREFAPARMFVVVAVGFGVTFKTNRNGVLDLIRSTFGCLFYVVCLDFDPAEAVANATATVASSKENFNIFTWESHCLFFPDSEGLGRL
jgi:hypothetical protein